MDTLIIAQQMWSGIKPLSVIILVQKMLLWIGEMPKEEILLMKKSELLSVKRTVLISYYRGFLRVVGVAGGVELLFPAKYLGDKRTLFGQQLLLTLRQSSLQYNVTMVTVRIGTTVSSPYDDGLQLEIPPVAIGNNWQTIQVG